MVGGLAPKERCLPLRACVAAPSPSSSPSPFPLPLPLNPSPASLHSCIEENPFEDAATGPGPAVGDTGVDSQRESASTVSKGEPLYLTALSPSGKHTSLHATGKMEEQVGEPQALRWGVALHFFFLTPGSMWRSMLGQGRPGKHSLFTRARRL